MRADIRGFHSSRLKAHVVAAVAGVGLLLAAVQPARAAVPVDPAVCDVPGFQQILHPAAQQFDARAVWLSRQWIRWPHVGATGNFRLYYAGNAQITAHAGSKLQGADGAIDLDIYQGMIPPQVAARFKYVGDGVTLSIQGPDYGKLPDLHQKQLVLVREDAAGKVLDATELQAAGALDDLYKVAADEPDLGATLHASKKGIYTRFKLWAPTAQKAMLCLYDGGQGKAAAAVPMQFDENTGIWSTGKREDFSGKYYRYMVDVFVRGSGIVRNRVTDPYSVSLTTDSQRSYIADLNNAALKPDGWDKTPVPATVAAQPDMTIYELHVRDFSVNDPTVEPAHRGKYLAFTDAGSNGMRQLQALAKAGLTDVHLLPVFDFATVPEAGCVTPDVPKAAPDSEAQQAAVMAVAQRDCFNWGYDPYHYGAPEGSYASDPADGAKRIVEFRQMVQALHRTGLRVGMDVVYNHTAEAGQGAQSVLDRIVPGYYQRLDARGAVEQSTCSACGNTATENRMMAKLMIDTALRWATQYRIDSFRFDLMAHQPRAVMEDLQARLDRATGHHVNLIGEGWNFGEVANGARFVQASQLSLNGSGIGTFSDRGRDAIRGGGAGESGIDLVRHQGYVNGLVYDPNPVAGTRPVTDLMQAADMVRVGLAGSIRDYTMTDYRDRKVQLQQIVYGGDQPAGYASQPGEVVNYFENHDNQTLFDIDALKLPRATSGADRARVQMLAAAITAFSQGVSYFHAGSDLLRSKSMDRNSFNSGDWFNRVDWSGRDNNFGVGAPPKQDNGNDYPLTKPLLADAALKPAPADIALARGMFRDLLAIRASSTLFRLRSADDIRRRLQFYNTGAQQQPTVLVGHLDGKGYAGARFDQLIYFINVDKAAHDIAIPAEKGKRYTLHPVQAAAGATDQRPAQEARYDSASGRFHIPARSTVVYVVQ